MKITKYLFIFVAATMMAACGTTNHVPITGRKQNLLVSNEQVLSLSNQQYSEYMKSAKAHCHGETRRPETG